ncbi:Na+/H+ antiporter subunit E [Mangrovicoccus ximenensis]|uniref:Na+/H+ antiporter subunit E n=1 Tax=Mangrovicoccus ximenensis TaxID=1911570 RepID=UPI000D343A3B|nr:Na+/H+ antiporter subunit E [Mangrovicoccus ximenensis]
MTGFGLNLLLAIAWVALTESVTLANLVIGFVLGYAVLWLVRPILGPSRYPDRALAWIRLVLFFFYELVVSSVAVAVDILTPRHRAEPAIIDMPLDVRSDAGILLVTNLISLTPGTLSLDISEDRRTLRIHAMFARDPEALVRDLKQGMEAKVIAAVEGET